WRRLLGAVASVGFFALTLVALVKSPLNQCCNALPEAVQNDTHAIGLALLDFSGEGYVLPFEVISLVLLAALIGGIVIARKLPPMDQP
ncbi:TPA: hypothetical protein DDW35_01610, partial [Candidatus Sumerlaeota bacterium]|nr:hypothetical protein [Candidatus Sumerlaeota bacterium]